MQYKRPVIAITASKNDEGSRLLIHQAYMQMLLRHGALPVLLPMTADTGTIEEIANRFDGFVLSGGGDIDSVHWGEPLHEKASGLDPERDAMELALVRSLHQKKEKPVLCICRGEQVMNAALGGTLIQDIPSQVDGTIGHREPERQHESVHDVQVLPGTRLASIVGAGALGVNTLHHQAVRDVAPVLTACAAAADGVIEAIESREHPFFIGVQWHPERLGSSDRGADALFAAFCEACANRHAPEAHR